MNRNPSLHENPSRTKQITATISSTTRATVEVLWPPLVRILWTRREGYYDLLIGLRTVGLAFVLTLVTYLLLNAWLTSRIDALVHDFRPPGLREATSTADAVAILIREGQADARLKPWLEAHLEHDQPLSRQIDRLYGSIASSEDTGAFSRVTALEELAGGSRSSVWPLGYIQADLIAPSEAFQRLAEVEPGWGERLAAGDDSELQSQFLTTAIGWILKASENRVRELLRFNGWVQWLTVFLAWLIVVLLICRVRLIRRLRRVWAHGLPESREMSTPGSQELVALAKLLLSNQHAEASRAELTMIHQEEFGRLASGVEERVYATLAFLLGCLPSLGFLGTILGMGEALLQANGLLSAEHREQTISQMTQQLGFAFDTTFVALLCSLVVGCLVAGLRSFELRWLNDLESNLVAQILPAEAPEEVVA